MGDAGGDRSDRWRASYRSVRKDVLRSSDRTNLQRLALVGASELVGESPWLDLGAGDGNLGGSLARLGVHEVIALDYQTELLADVPAVARPVGGSATCLPFADSSMAVVVAMDLLHHLHPSSLSPALQEVRRVLRPDGTFLSFEPADTTVRRVLTVALMSPVSQLWRFSRDKRTMVELEASTLDPWLGAERVIDARLAAEGFIVERVRHRLLHDAGRCRGEAG